MISFFGDVSNCVIAVESLNGLQQTDIEKLSWLFGDMDYIEDNEIDQNFIGPRVNMITPWSTNAVEITQNMGIDGIKRIEQFLNEASGKVSFDPMINQKYRVLSGGVFNIDLQAASLIRIEDIAKYNEEEGLALSEDEIQYLHNLSKEIGRPLTDSEVFGFSQVNSEHCRHKIFNGEFVLNGASKQASLFSMIKKTSKENENEIVSAYKDNVAFINGPQAVQFSPDQFTGPSTYKKKRFESVISLKAETHNFPTTVEPFSGAGTGSGGEIRDRLAGGTGSIPLAGTALYMTPYPRLKSDKAWEAKVEERNWLYQTPEDILIKASNGASDFGNKFGQPLINGSLTTFEHDEEGTIQAYDKVIMMAGGVGYTKKEYAKKNKPNDGDLVVILGGDNYRIGMGGAAVSSADTGAFGASLELNAVQRSNPEMQKRVADTIRALVESTSNPIVSIHDHGAGGHLNCLTELLEDTGGLIEIDKLPLGDPTLSVKEIIGNESQERMGLLISANDLITLRQIAERERCPMYVVGKVGSDNRYIFSSESREETALDLHIDDLFGSSPKTIMIDQDQKVQYTPIEYDTSNLNGYLEQVLSLESVACKDWLTNKVDRCVGGRVAKQQCCGPLQLPLNNLGVMALDYDTKGGIATAMGHASIAALIDPAAGSRLAIAEALTNIIWAPLKKGIKSISLSANWMWPCKNPGEDARLYEAVEEVSDFAIQLGINVPTGKDSLSMKQKYSDREVKAPGTVVITAVGECIDKTAVIEPVLQKNGGDVYYVNLGLSTVALGGSAFAQVRSAIGQEAPNVMSATAFAYSFDFIQDCIKDGKIEAGHDVSSGGLISCLLEMCFADNKLGADIDLSELPDNDDRVKLLFSENPGVVIQSSDPALFEEARSKNIPIFRIGSVNTDGLLNLTINEFSDSFHVSALRDIWYETSYLLDEKQTASGLAKTRFLNYKKQPLTYQFPSTFDGRLKDPSAVSHKPIAAVLREKGSNSEREMAHALFLAGFEVRDVHMTDLISGRETLEDIQFLGAVGGFSNSDVLGSAKGWAGAIKYNEKAKEAFDRFFAREDTLSIGICNGCQLFMELNLINPEHKQQALMIHNESQKHESAFTSVTIEENNSVMLKTLAGTRLGIWISHGEGKFNLPMEEKDYHIVAKYGYDAYPSNPNGSAYNTAMIASKDGRHLATMPHLERSIFPWNWAHYPTDRNDEISPWLEAFVNARKWLEEKSANETNLS